MYQFFLGQSSEDNTTPAASLALVAAAPTVTSRLVVVNAFGDVTLTAPEPGITLGPIMVTSGEAEADLVAQEPIITIAGIVRPAQFAEIILVANEPSVSQGSVQVTAGAAVLGLDIGNLPEVGLGSVSLSATADLALVAAAPTVSGSGAVSLTTPVANLTLVAEVPGITNPTGQSTPTVDLTLVAAAPTVSFGAVSLSATADLALVSAAPSITVPSVSVTTPSSDLAMVAINPVVQLYVGAYCSGIRITSQFTTCDIDVAGQLEACPAVKCQELSIL